MRRAILVLSLFLLPLAAIADEAKPAPAKAEAKVTAAAPEVKEAAAPAPAPAEAEPAEAAPAPDAEAKQPAPAAAPAKVLKVVNKVDEPTKADPIPDDPEEIVLLVKQLINAAKGGNWQLFVGLLLTLLVWILRKFNIIAFLPDKAVPWVAALIGMVGYLGIALASGVDLTTALIQGFLTGAAAVGLWEMLGKHVLKKSKKEEAPAKA